MSKLPFYFAGPGSGLSATTENQRNRVIREGQLTGGKGVMVSRSGTGSTVSLTPQPRRVLPLPLGGVFVLETSQTYDGTAVQATMSVPTGILGAIDNKLTGPGQMLDLDAATPDVTLSQPGRYLIHYQVTCGFDTAEISGNVSDAVTRARLSIGGTLKDDSAIFGTHHVKLCATGLVHDVTLGTLSATTEMDPMSSGYGDVTFSGELGVSKVGAYDRWLDGRLTISGTYQVIVFNDAGGAAKIATAAPVDDPPTAPTGTTPTIGLWVDRYDVEPNPGVDPFSATWEAAPTMRLHDAQLHIIRLT